MGAGPRGKKSTSKGKASGALAQVGAAPGPTKDPRAEAKRLGFLQLCADRRFHRAIMDAFEWAVTEHEKAHAPKGELGPFRDHHFWIEAAAGGAPSLDVASPTCAFAVSKGTKYLGWSAHGDDCGGFPGMDDAHMLQILRAAVVRRGVAFPHGVHWAFLAIAEDDCPETDHVQLWSYDPATATFTSLGTWENGAHCPPGESPHDHSS